MEKNKLKSKDMQTINGGTIVEIKNGLYRYLVYDVTNFVPPECVLETNNFILAKETDKSVNGSITFYTHQAVDNWIKKHGTGTSTSKFLGEDN